ncbi:MAG TPA: glycosyltransferase [Bacteroidota bacterium]
MKFPTRIALVHDWLTGMRGGEKCLEVLCELFPAATLFTLLRRPNSTSTSIERMEIRTSFIHDLPLSQSLYRYYLPLFPTAIEQFDLRGYDMVVSLSHCVAKGIRPPPDALHVCYCFTPMRYVWDQYELYFGKGRGGFFTPLVAPFVARSLRTWDVASSSRVDHFVAISKHVQSRIRRYYRRESSVIYPPVDVSAFSLSEKDGGYYLIVSALVPYKRIDLAIEAFNRTSERLVIVGGGPDEWRLKSRAGKNIEFVGNVSAPELPPYYENCRAFIFPGEEDFGITAVEAQACGKPVIAYARGGALETVMATGANRTGVFFDDPTVESLNQALREFQSMKFRPTMIRRNAERFARPIFIRRIERLLQEKWLDRSRTAR